MASEFDDEAGWDELARNVDIDDQILIARAQQSSGPPSQQVSALTSRIHHLDEQV